MTADPYFHIYKSFNYLYQLYDYMMHTSLLYSVHYKAQKVSFFLGHVELIFIVMSIQRRTENTKYKEKCCIAVNLLIISRHRHSILQCHFVKNHIRANSSTVFHVLDRCDSHFCLIYFIKKKCQSITNKTFIHIFFMKSFQSAILFCDGLERVLHMCASPPFWIVAATCI